MGFPKVSIVIPMYGVEEYIGNCLHSVTLQDYPYVEALVINDCSRDRSLEIANTVIDAYEGPIEFRILHHEQNQGLSGARNTGIKASTGEYIYFLDGDDELLPGAITALVDAVMQTGCDIATANRRAEDWETGKEYKMIDADYRAGRADSIKELLDNQLHGTVWNKLVKRDFIIHNNLFFKKEALASEDELWTYKLICCKPSVCFIPQITYIYYVRSGSLLQTFGEKHLLAKMIIAAEAVKDLPKLRGESYSYALKEVERFRQGVLVSAVTHLQDKDYKLVYKLMRRIKIDRCKYLSQHDLSIPARLRFLNNYLPVTLGAWWNRMFIKAMLRKSKFKLIYLEVGKLSLKSDFFEKADELLRFDDGKNLEKD